MRAKPFEKLCKKEGNAGYQHFLGLKKKKKSVKRSAMLGTRLVLAFRTMFSSHSQIQPLESNAFTLYQSNVYCVQRVNFSVSA